jgi:Asp-tRNA(Asn)/Glu-tRNA(Gln) amidotransferase B subunit
MEQGKVYEAEAGADVEVSVDKGGARCDVNVNVAQGATAHAVEGDTEDGGARTC